MRMNKITKVVIGITLLSLVLSACGSPASTQVPELVENEALPTVGTEAPFKLKVSIIPYLSNTVLMIAQNDGYFAEQNLDVEFIPFANTNELIPLLIAGELDAAAPSPNAGFFNAVAKESNIKLVLPLTDFVVKDCATVAYLARTEDVQAGKYADKKSWVDARMVISTQALNSVPGFVLARTLAPSGLTVDEMNTVVVDSAAQEEALRNGQVDIVYAVEPSVTRMTAKGDISILDFAEQYVPGLTSSMIVVGPRILENPDVGKGFAIAYLKAVRKYLEGPTESNVALASELTGLPADLVKKLCWSNASPDGVVNVPSLMEYQNFLLERELLDQVVEPEKFYEPSFAAEALLEIGSQLP